MDYHHHARLTIYSREQLARNVLEGRLSLREAAAECRLSRQSAAKWVRRYREVGQGRVDRSLQPSALFAAHHAGGTGGACRTVAPRALDRGADRAGHRAEPGHCQPHPGSAQAEQGRHARTALGPWFAMSATLPAI